MKVLIAHDEPVITTTPKLLDIDIWEAEQIGLKPDAVNGTYRLNFIEVKPLWFKQAIKRFIHFQSATKSFSSCFSYLGRLKHFSQFLIKKDPLILAQEVNRAVIVSYIEYLSLSKLSIVTRNMALIHLRTFHGILLQEEWLPWPAEPLIYSSDILKLPQDIPKYIPEQVLSQLQYKLHHLPEYMQNLITVLLETGRRVSEVCTLPLDCIEQDHQGDCFLKVHESKLKKSYLIPISDICIEKIKSQQQLVKIGTFKNKLYLFPTIQKLKTLHISARTVNHSLNKLANEYNIISTSGEIWKFHSHQFRHTVGTRMINAGVPQTIVQKYLGHESPEMTSRYAHIHDDTLKKAFNEYKGKLVTIEGAKSISNLQEENNEVKWLKHNIMSQALPNGLCALPSPQQKCPHANACLSCVHFRTHNEFLPQHKKQLKKTEEIIKSAEENGWQRQVEMNVTVKISLEKIINALEEK